MSSIEEKNHQTATECSAQREKMYRHIAEVCDRETRESIHEWHRRRRERDDESQSAEFKVQSGENKTL